MATSTLVSDPRVKAVRCTDETLEVDLADGRRITVPLAWFPRLVAASAAERADWQASAAGHGIHWPAIDEDISIEGLLRGEKAPG